jgi:hypothetical protein
MHLLARRVMLGIGVDEKWMDRRTRQYEDLKIQHTDFDIDKDIPFSPCY